MIDTTTIRWTPARSPTSWRLRAEAVKNSLAPSWPDVAASTTHSTPARASLRPSPVTTSTPVDRDIGTTSWPASSSTSTVWRPTLPVAPATAIFLRSAMSVSFVKAVQQDDERQMREGTALGRGAADLLDSALQEPALGFGCRQLQRSLECRPSLLEPVQPAQELRAGRVEVLVAVEVEPLEEREPRRRPVGLGDRDRAVHLDDR